MPWIHHNPRQPHEMRIAYIKPEDDKLRIIGMKDELSEWHKLIQCDMIEAHELIPGTNILFVCDESGKLKNKEPNFFWGEYFPDIVVGTVAFCSQNGPEFDNLSDEQISLIRAYLDKHSFIKPMRKRKENT